MVSPCKTFIIETSAETSSIQNITAATNQSGRGTSTPQEARDTHLSSVRTHLTTKGFSSQAVQVIMASWRDSTKTQYQTYIKKWENFCAQNECSFLDPPISKAVDFLTGLFHQGLSYTSINTARSALSALLHREDNNIPFGQLPLVKRFMKGIFELRPSFPRYESVWDVNKVFDYFRHKSKVSDLSLKELSERLTFLLLLLSGQRSQTIHLLSIASMELSPTRCVFQVKEKVKQSRVGYHIAPIVYEEYPKDPALCILKHINEYIKRTQKFRKPDHSQLLVSYVKPNKPVSRETIARWCKSVLKSAGIDTKRFSCHSTRAVSTSLAVEKSGDIDIIISSVGWSAVFLDSITAVKSRATLERP